MKQQLSFYNSLEFQQYTSNESKIIEILVISVIKTADVSKLFLAIFERTYDGLYICHFLWLQRVFIKSNDRGCNFALPHVKRALKSKPKMVRELYENTFQAGTFTDIHAHTTVIKRYLKTFSCTFIMKNQLRTEAFVAFLKSLPSVTSISSLSIAT